MQDTMTSVRMCSSYQGTQTCHDTLGRLDTSLRRITCQLNCNLQTMLVPADCFDPCICIDVVTENLLLVGTS